MKLLNEEADSWAPSSTLENPADVPLEKPAASSQAADAAHPVPGDSTEMTEMTGPSTLSDVLLKAKLKNADVFKWEENSAHGAAATLRRIAALMPAIAAFVAKTRISEGILSKAQVLKELDARSMNAHNLAQHQLAEARHSCLSSGERSSRAAGWMKSQASFCKAFSEIGPAGEPHKPLKPADSFGPYREQPQVLLYRYDVSPTSYELRAGVLLEVFRDAAKWCPNIYWKLLSNHRVQNKI